MLYIWIVLIVAGLTEAKNPNHKHFRHHHRHHQPFDYHNNNNNLEVETDLIDTDAKSVKINRSNQSDQSDQSNETKCVSCVDRELYKNFTREEIREKILRRLGMSNPPNVSVTDSVPNSILSELKYRYNHQLSFDPEMQNDQPDIDLDDQDELQTKQISIFAQNPANMDSDSTDLGVVMEENEWDIHYFKLQGGGGGVFGSEVRRYVSHASLWLHLDQAPSEDDRNAFIAVSTVSKDKLGHHFLTQEKTRTHKLSHKSETVKININEIVSMWLAYPETNLGLVIEVKTSTGQSMRIGSSSNVPMLQLSFKGDIASNNLRRKRNLSKFCTENVDSNENRCCLWPFEIDFEKEYGWKWIIHPTKYQANFCSGDCSLGVMMPSNSYAHLIQQANRKPCCAPQKFSGINMLYMDENKNVILGKLPNMKVERCGCA